MTIKVQGPDGAVHTFPDNAKPDQITEALKSVYQAPGDGQSFGQRAEAAATAANVDTGPDTQGPLGLYADTVKQFPANLMNAQNHSYAMLRSGLHDLGQGDMSGLIGAGIGGLGFVGAPVTAALTPALKPVNTFVSQPLENATGGMIPAPVTTAALSALIPGMGITRGPMSVRPSVPLGMSRPAGEVLLRQLSTDDTLSGTGAARIRQGGPNAMVADAGPAAANLLDTAMQRSGPGATQARQAVEGRAAQANTDLTGALDRAMGPAEGVDTQQTGIRTRTAPIREQAYNAAYRQPIDYTTIHGRNIERLVDRVPPEAITQANKMMRAEGSASRQIKATINDDGTVSFEQLPDVRQLDYITRGLNEVAQGAEGQGVMRGTTAVGRIYGNLSQEIRGNLREAVPEYGHALDTAADPIQRIQAIEFGATILNPKVTRDQVAQQFQGMGAGERRAAISGLRSQIDEISANVKSMASDPNVDARQLREMLRGMSSAAAREKITAALGPAVTHQLMSQVGRSARALELRAQVATNSRTFGRTATAAQVAAQAEPSPLGLLMEMHPVRAAQKFVQSITKMTPERRLAMEDRIYGQIADALTRHRGRDAEQFLGQLRSEITLRAGQRARDARRLGSAPVNSTQAITQSISPALPQLRNLQAQPQQQQPDPDQAARPALPVNQAAWSGKGGPESDGTPGVNDWSQSREGYGHNRNGAGYTVGRFRSGAPALTGAATSENDPATVERNATQAARELAATRPATLTPPNRNAPMTWASRGAGDQSAGEIVPTKAQPVPAMEDIIKAMNADFAKLREGLVGKRGFSPAEARSQERLSRRQFAERGYQMREGNRQMNELERVRVESDQQDRQQRVVTAMGRLRDLFAEMMAHHGHDKGVPSVSGPRNF